ncbi:hypothetical protein ACIO8G_32430 [Streptomyces sp. NPDC087219]|uniref:hypothetical protein n=1 Tax=Streptomyces sp. NPDC087219 TaxID=3365770 RepID=UPI0037FD1259
MIPIEDLVPRVAAKARATSSTLPSAAGAEEVAAAEAVLGFALPPLLASLYRRWPTVVTAPITSFFHWSGQGVRR